MQIRAFVLPFLLCCTALAQLAERPRASRPLDSPLPAGQLLPTGMAITPDAAPGAQFLQLTPNAATLSAQPVSSEISPDGNTLLVLTSGYNSTEYVFVYDISNHTPVLQQALPLAASFVGLAWNPNGKEFYVSGGSKDVVYVFTAQSPGSTLATFALSAQISLGHKYGLGLGMLPLVAGMAVNSRGDTLVVANYLNCGSSQPQQLTCPA